MRHMSTLNAFVPAWLAHAVRRRTVTRAVRRTFARWKTRFPLWVNSGFDEHFLLHDALPLLSDILTGVRAPDPSLLARQWITAHHIPAPHAPLAMAALPAVAADFLALLQVEYSAHQA